MYSAVCTAVPYLRSPHETLHETLQTSNIIFPTNTTILPLYLRQFRKYIPKDEAKISRTTSSSPPCLRPQPTILHIHLAPNALLLRQVTVTTRPLVPRPPIGRPPPWCDIGHPAAGSSTTSLLSYTAQHSTSHYPGPTRDSPSLAPIALLRIPLRLPRTPASAGARNIHSCSPPA